jgi:hypothetical protein
MRGPISARPLARSAEISASRALEHGLIDKEHLRCCDEFRCYAE